MIELEDKYRSCYPDNNIIRKKERFYWHLEPREIKYANIEHKKEAFSIERKINMHLDNIIRNGGATLGSHKVLTFKRDCYVNGFTGWLLSIATFEGRREYHPFSHEVLYETNSEDYMKVREYRRMFENLIHRDTVLSREKEKVKKETLKKRYKKIGLALTAVLIFVTIGIFILNCEV